MLANLFNAHKHLFGPYKHGRWMPPPRKHANFTSMHDRLSDSGSDALRAPHTSASDRESVTGPPRYGTRNEPLLHSLLLWALCTVNTDSDCSRVHGVRPPPPPPPPPPHPPLPPHRHHSTYGKNAGFSSLTPRKPATRQPTMWEKFQDSRFSPNVLQWAPNYRKEDLRPDIIAGVTIAIMVRSMVWAPPTALGGGFMCHCKYTCCSPWFPSHHAHVCVCVYVSVRSCHKALRMPCWPTCLPSTASTLPSCRDLCRWWGGGGGHWLLARLALL